MQKHSDTLNNLRIKQPKQGRDLQKLKINPYSTKKLQDQAKNEDEKRKEKEQFIDLSNKGHEQDIFSIYSQGLVTEAAKRGKLLLIQYQRQRNQTILGLKSKSKLLLDEEAGDLKFFASEYEGETIVNKTIDKLLQCYSLEIIQRQKAHSNLKLTLQSLLKTFSSISIVLTMLFGLLYTNCGEKTYQNLTISFAILSCIFVGFRSIADAAKIQLLLYYRCFERRAQIIKESPPQDQSTLQVPAN